ncbi:hypothetical protein SUGI_0234830 [Cryptomeria japonica]|nr:hypothetical protein SUGI_0234830 [Cryptomeria japonica]
MANPPPLNAILKLKNWFWIWLSELRRKTQFPFFHSINGFVQPHKSPHFLGFPPEFHIFFSSLPQESRSSYAKYYVLQTCTVLPIAWHSRA